MTLCDHTMYKYLSRARVYIWSCMVIVHVQYFLGTFQLFFPDLHTRTYTITWCILHHWCILPYLFAPLLTWPWHYSVGRLSLAAFDVRLRSHVAPGFTFAYTHDMEYWREMRRFWVILRRFMRPRFRRNFGKGSLASLVPGYPGFVRLARPPPGLCQIGKLG